MRGLAILLICISSAVAAHTDHPENEKRRTERKKARIERKVSRCAWDERTPAQQQRDNKAMVYLAIGIVLILRSISKE